MCMHHFDGEAMAGDKGVHLGFEKLKFRFLLIVCQSRDELCFSALQGHATAACESAVQWGTQGCMLPTAQYCEQSRCFGLGRTNVSSGVCLQRMHCLFSFCNAGHQDRLSLFFGEKHCYRSTEDIKGSLPTRERRS